MKRREIIRYFRILSRLFREPCRIILTGAGAGALYGRIRATLDLDFAVLFKTRSRRKKERLWAAFDEASRKTTLRTGISVQYAEDIDRWSQITYLDYWKHTLSFRRFGSLEVRLLEVPYWAIGKLARYLDPDIRDLVEVLKSSKVDAGVLARVLGRALAQSPRSTACEAFRRQVEDFLSSYGRRIWGKKIEPGRLIGLFRTASGFRK